VSILDQAPPALFEGFLRRGDFSRWIRDVFGDYPLAMELQTLEERHRAGASADTVPDIAAAIRARYELVGDADRLEVA
jgi:hypothetical protein